MAKRESTAAPGLLARPRFLGAGYGRMIRKEFRTEPHRVSDGGAGGGVLPHLLLRAHVRAGHLLQALHAGPGDLRQPVGRSEIFPGLLPVLLRRTHHSQHDPDQRPQRALGIPRTDHPWPCSSTRCARARFKRAVQSLTYLPHFISLVVVCGLLLEFSRNGGLFNDIRGLLGAAPIPFFQDPRLFPRLLHRQRHLAGGRLGQHHLPGGAVGHRPAALRSRHHRRRKPVPPAPSHHAALDRADHRRAAHPCGWVSS